MTGGQYTGVDVTIISNGNTNAIGVYATGPGRVDLTGGSVVTNGGDGLSAEGGGEIVARGLVIDSLGAASSGVWSSGVGSSIDLTDATVSAAGDVGGALVAADGGAITGEGLVLSTQGVIGQSHIVLAVGSGSRIEISNSQMSSDAPFIGGLYANNRGEIVASNIRIHMTGEESDAVVSAGGPGVITISDSTLLIEGEKARGINAWSASQIQSSNVAIETRGDGGTGIYSAQAGTVVTVSGGSILTLGDMSYGLQSTSKGTIIASDLPVTTMGQRAHGAYAIGANTLIDLTNSAITTYGVGAEGVRAEDSAHTTATGTTIVTSGVDAFGLSARSQGAITASDLSLTTSGQGAYGAAAAGAGSLIDLTDAMITTGGAGAGGVRAEDSARTTATGVTIVTSGDDASGVVASAATVVLDGGSVTTSGASAHGLGAQDGADLIASNVTTQVSGSTAAAVQITGGTLATPTTMTVDGGTLASSQGPLILAQGGTGTIVLKGPIAISAGLVGGNPALAMVANGATPSNLTLNLTDLGAVSGNVMVTGADNQVNATFKTTDWIGDLIAEPGNMPSITLQDSHWTGQATHASNIRLNAASAWAVTGTSNAVGTITNAGLIQFAPLASGFSTLTTGNYDGQGGHIAFNTVLGADNSATNLLVINGGTATGTTMLSVTNAGGGGDLTVGDGIRLVQAVNGGITQPGAFALTERVTAGAYEYLLFRGGSSGTDDWFLRSSIDAKSIDPHAPGGVIPLYRPEVPLYTPIPAMARHIGLATLGTLHERVGEEMNIRDLTSSGRFGNGAWMRVIGERSNNRWIDTAESNVRAADLIGIQAGLDLYRRQHDNGHRDHVGLYAAYTDYRSSSVSGLARGQRNQQVGQLTLNGPAVGAYWTHFGPSGWYLDGVIQGNWFDAKANSFDDTGMSTRGTGLTASLEGGYPIHLSQRWQLEPQAQIIYQTVSVKDSRDVYSTIGWNESDAVTGRFGGRLQYSAQDGAALWQPYAKVNLWHSFNGTDWASFGASPAIESRFGNTSVELGGGITARITRTASLYGHVDHRWSVDGRERRTATQGAIGVRFNW